MITAVNKPVMLHLVIDSVNMVAVPYRIKWQGKTYVVKEVGFARSQGKGDHKVHVFQMNVGSCDMRIHVDGNSLHSTLVEISDGLLDIKPK